MNISEIESVINRDFMPQEIETTFRLYPMLFQIENIDYINLILDKFALELILSQNKQILEDEESKYSDDEKLNVLNLCFYFMDEFKFRKHYNYCLELYKKIIKKDVLTQVPTLNIDTNEEILIPRSTNDELMNGLLNNAEINYTTLEHMLKNINSIYDIILNFNGNDVVKENLNKMLMKSSTYILNTSDFYSKYFDTYNIFNLNIDENILTKSENLIKLSNVLTKIFVSLSNTDEIQITSLKILAFWTQIQLLYKIKENNEKLDLKEHREILLYGLIMRKLKTYIHNCDDIFEFFKNYCHKFYINTANKFYEYYSTIKNENKIGIDYKEYIKTCVLENYKKANYMVEIVDENILKKIEELNGMKHRTTTEINSEILLRTIGVSPDTIKPGIYQDPQQPSENRTTNGTGNEQFFDVSLINLDNENATIIQSPLIIDNLTEELSNYKYRNNSNNFNTYLLGWTHDILKNYIKLQEKQTIKNSDYEFYLGHFALITNILKYNSEETMNIEEDYPMSNIIHTTIDILKDMCKNINISIENLNVAIKEETRETLKRVIENSINYINNTHDFFNDNLFLENLISQIPLEIIPIIAGGFYNSHVIKNKYQSDDNLLMLFKKLSIKYFVAALEKKVNEFNQIYSISDIISIYIYYNILTLVLKYEPNQWKELYDKLINTLHEHYSFYTNLYYNYYMEYCSDKIDKIITEIKLLKSIYFAKSYGVIDEKYIRIYDDLIQNYTITINRKRNEGGSNIQAPEENIEISDLMAVVADAYPFDKIN